MVGIRRLKLATKQKCIAERGSLFPVTVLPTPDPSNHNQMQQNTIEYVQHICPNTTMYNKLFLVTVLPKPDPKWNCPKHWETHNAR